jgi:hypothetical protein
LTGIGGGVVDDAGLALFGHDQPVHWLVVQGALDLKIIGKKIEKSGKWKNFGKITKIEKITTKK